MKAPHALRMITAPAAASCAVVCFAPLARPAMAQSPADINSVAVQERRFNDFPTSTLVTTDNYPSLVSFRESNYGSGNPPPPPFANQHLARFAVDETPFFFQNDQDRKGV